MNRKENKKFVTYKDTEENFEKLSNPFVKKMVDTEIKVV